MHVAALVGSLRHRSYNRMTYNAAVSLAPDGLTFEEADIGSLPLYDDDLRAQQGYPPAASRLRERIAAADALLIVSPEYNYSIPGVLKNAIDWASRPPDQPFKGKPVAIMGASTGRFGTVRMPHHLRQTLVFVEALPLAKPEVMIPFAEQAFDADGRLIDEAARETITAQLQASWRGSGGWAAGERHGQHFGKLADSAADRCTADMRQRLFAGKNWCPRLESNQRHQV